MTRVDVSNGDKVIDSRDVIARIVELETELQDAHTAEGNDGSEFDAWLTNADQDTEHTMQDAAHELIVLRALADEASGSPDWTYGETLIRDSYFTEYAQELAEDCGMIADGNKWPNRCIDWDKAADELKQDYMSVDFNGEEYWIRG